MFSNHFSLIFPIKRKINVADVSVEDLMIFYLNRIWCIFEFLHHWSTFFNKNRLRKRECSLWLYFFQHLSSIPKSCVFLLQHFLTDSQNSQFWLVFFFFGSLQGKEDPLVRCKALWLVSSWKVLKTTKKLPSVKRTPMFPPRQVLSHKGMTLFSRINVLETNSLHKTIWYTWLFIRECFRLVPCVVSLH